MVDINREWLDESAREVRGMGGDDCVLPIVADVADYEAVEAAVNRTIAELGGTEHTGQQRRGQPQDRGASAGGNGRGARMRGMCPGKRGPGW